MIICIAVWCDGRRYEVKLAVYYMPWTRINTATENENAVDFAIGDCLLGAGMIEIWVRQE